jgi:hypothetical protein
MAFKKERIESWGGNKTSDWYNEQKIMEGEKWK